MICPKDNKCEIAETISQFVKHSGNLFHFLIEMDHKSLIHAFLKNKSLILVLAEKS